MVNNNEYLNFISDAKFPKGNREEDLWLIFKDKQILIKENKGRIITPTFKDVKNFIDGLETKYHLGELNGIHCFCGEINSCVETDGEYELISLRQGAAVIDKDIFPIWGRASQIIHFHKTNKYCSVCGAENKISENEFSMECSSCKYTTYPNVCPAIIVGITNGDKILLANNKNFPEGLHSVIAGFLDVNETLEDCVKREVLEEVGIKVKNIKYFDSQPWPYPNSIMIGFTAEYESGEIKVDGDEIVHAAWYKKDNLPMIPDETTIARRIIDSLL